MQASQLSDEQLAGYRDRILEPEQLASAATHLAGCEDCQARWRKMGGRVALSRLRARFERHLSYEQVAAWVDGERPLDVAEHLNECFELLGRSG